MKPHPESPKKDSIQISLSISMEMNNLLEETAVTLHTTKSDVVRKALFLLHWTTEAKKKGQKIGIFDNDRKLIAEVVGI